MGTKRRLARAIEKRAEADRRAGLKEHRRVMQAVGEDVPPLQRKGNHSPDALYLAALALAFGGTRRANDR